MDGDIKRDLGDRRIAGVIPITFGRARIVVSRDPYTYEDGW